MPELEYVLDGGRKTAALPVTVIERSRGPVNLADLWEYRELLYFLVWRDIKVRYKQTFIGAGWTLIQPLLTMVVFTFIFARLASVPSDGLPYPLFSYAALLPWNYFSRSLGNSVNSVAGSAHLITKIYFPRLLLPIAACLSGLIDVAISMVFLFGLMIWYRVSPSWIGLLALPLLFLFAILTALSISLWLSALNVRYRDVGQAIPFLLQLWLFVSPVAYPASIVPEKWRFLYNLNPMTTIVEGFRWALLQSAMPPVTLMVISVLLVLAILWTGFLLFRRLESTFADVV
jgi:lipopolysaccharide transport system permease protein